MVRLWVLAAVASCLLLAGCADQLTAHVVDEHGCADDESWCVSKDRCVSEWEEYCPLEGESDRLMTADDCNRQGGTPIDYGNGNRCAPDEKVVGQVAGLLSLHVCCLPVA